MSSDLVAALRSMREAVEEGCDEDQLTFARRARLLHQAAADQAAIRADLAQISEALSSSEEARLA